MPAARSKTSSARPANPAAARALVDQAFVPMRAKVIEVAAFLDIPLGTVKTRTRSALARLAVLLEEELM